MKHIIEAVCLNDRSANMERFQIEMPKECSNCCSAWSPINVAAGFVPQDKYYRMDVMMFCPKCEHTSIAVYFGEKKFNQFENFQKLELITVLPKAVPQIDKFPEIEKNYPEFWNIYTQALAAESYDLQDIAGVGLRKALEFLVKEYAIAESPDDKNDIEIMTLSQCINNYIHVPRIKDLVNRAVWLGNDQTHYINKHGFELKDLLRLTELVLYFIEMDLEAKSAIKNIIKL